MFRGAAKGLIVGLVATAVLTVAMVVGWDKFEGLRLRTANTALQEENGQLRAKNNQLTAQNERLRVAVELLTLDERRALFQVVDQRVRDDGKTLSLIHWVELNAAGKPLGPTQTRVTVGEDGYIQSRVIAFEDDFVMTNDPLKGHALVVFEKLYGSGEALDSVLPLGTPYPQDDAEPLSEFAAQMWAKFEALATDPFEAEQHGVRYAQHISAGKPLIRDKMYRVVARATGELFIEPLSAADAAATPIPAPSGPPLSLGGLL